MADNNTTTGVSQGLLMQLTKTGLNQQLDASLFNSKMFENTQQNGNEQIPDYQPLKSFRLNDQNAPNTSAQNRELGNRYMDVNEQVFNNQQRSIVNAGQEQTNQLTQQAKDANSMNLAMFGQGGIASSTESSRNLSFLTDTNARLRESINSITNKSLELLGQNTANFANNNLQASQTVRAADFADRQQQFNEDITRGEEQGYVFNKGTRVNQNGRELQNLRGKAFDAETLGTVTMDNGKQYRTLQAMQVDTGLVSERLRQALSLSDITGEMPNLNAVNNLDQTIGNYRTYTPGTTGQLSQVGQIREYDSEVSRRLLSDPDYMNKLVETKKLELDGIQSQLRYNEELQKALKDGTAFGNSGIVQKEYQTALDAYNKNKNADTAKSLLDATEKYKKTFGTDNGMYYDVQTPKVDKEGNITIDVKYKDDGLAKFGFNGNASFNSDDPMYQEKLKEMQKNFSDSYFQAAASGDIASKINKVFFKDESNQDRFLLMLRQVNDKGNSTGYKLSEVDMTGLNNDDKIKLQDAIQKGQFVKTDGTKLDISNDNPKSLQNLIAILNDYKSKNSNFKFNDLDSVSFFGRLNQYKTKEGGSLADYAAVSSPEKGTISNKKVLASLMLASQPAGSPLVTDDQQLVKFSTFTTAYNQMVQEINNKTGALNKDGPAFTSADYDSIFNRMVTDNQITIQTKKGLLSIDNKFNDDQRKILANLRTWYQQYKDSNGEAVAGDYMQGMLFAAGNVDVKQGGILYPVSPNSSRPDNLNASSSTTDNTNNQRNSQGWSLRGWPFE